MNRLLNSVFAAGTLAVAFLGITPTGQGQERPERRAFDPEQARARMTEMYKERLEIKDEAEWKAIQPLVEKVVQAQREARSTAGFGGAMMGRPGRGGPGGGGPGPGAQGGADNDGGGRRRGGGGGGGFGGGGPEANADVEGLQKALEAKASAEELKAKLAKVREGRKAKEMALEKAQEELRQVLSVRQEAAAVLIGLLK